MIISFLSLMDISNYMFVPQKKFTYFDYGEYFIKGSLESGQFRKYSDPVHYARDKKNYEEMESYCQVNKARTPIFVDQDDLMLFTLSIYQKSDLLDMGYAMKSPNDWFDSVIQVCTFIMGFHFKELVFGEFDINYLHYHSHRGMEFNNISKVEMEPSNPSCFAEDVRYFLKFLNQSFALVKKDDYLIRYIEKLKKLIPAYSYLDIEPAINMPTMPSVFFALRVYKTCELKMPCITNSLNQALNSMYIQAEMAINEFLVYKELDIDFLKCYLEEERKISKFYSFGVFLLNTLVFLSPKKYLEAILVMIRVASFCFMIDFEYLSQGPKTALLYLPQVLYFDQEIHVFRYEKERNRKMFYLFSFLSVDAFVCYGFGVLTDKKEIEDLFSHPINVIQETFQYQKSHRFYPFHIWETYFDFSSLTKYYLKGANCCDKKLSLFFMEEIFRIENSSLHPIFKREDLTKALISNTQFNDFVAINFLIWHYGFLFHKALDVSTRYNDLDFFYYQLTIKLVLNKIQLYTNNHALILKGSLTNPQNKYLTECFLLFHYMCQKSLTIARDSEISVQCNKYFMEKLPMKNINNVFKSKTIESSLLTFFKNISINHVHDKSLALFCIYENIQFLNLYSEYINGFPHEFIYAIGCNGLLYDSSHIEIKDTMCSLVISGPILYHFREILMNDYVNIEYCREIFKELQNHEFCSEKDFFYFYSILGDVLEKVFNSCPERDLVFEYIYLLIWRDRNPKIKHFATLIDRMFIGFVFQTPMMNYIYSLFISQNISRAHLEAIVFNPTEHISFSALIIRQILFYDDDLVSEIPNNTIEEIFFHYKEVPVYNNNIFQVSDYFCDYFSIKQANTILQKETDQFAKKYKSQKLFQSMKNDESMKLYYYEVYQFWLEKKSLMYPEGFSSLSRYLSIHTLKYRDGDPFITTMICATFFDFGSVKNLRKMLPDNKKRILNGLIYMYKKIKNLMKNIKTK